jgi:hypothetical protein
VAIPAPAPTRPVVVVAGRTRPLHGLGPDPVRARQIAEIDARDAAREADRARLATRVASDGVAHGSVRRDGWRTATGRTGGTALSQVRLTEAETMTPYQIAAAHARDCADALDAMRRIGLSGVWTEPFERALARAIARCDRLRDSTEAASSVRTPRSVAAVRTDRAIVTMSRATREQDRREEGSLYAALLRAEARDLLAVIDREIAELAADLAIIGETAAGRRDLATLVAVRAEIAAVASISADPTRERRLGRVPIRPPAEIAPSIATAPFRTFPAYAGYVASGKYPDAPDTPED